MTKFRVGDVVRVVGEECRVNEVADDLVSVDRNVDGGTWFRPVALTLLRRPVRAGDVLMFGGLKAPVAEDAYFHALTAENGWTHADGTPIEAPRAAPSVAARYEQVKALLDCPHGPRISPEDARRLLECPDAAAVRINRVAAPFTAGVRKVTGLDLQRFDIPDIDDADLLDDINAASRASSPYTLPELTHALFVTDPDVVAHVRLRGEHRTDAMALGWARACFGYQPERQWAERAAERAAAVLVALA